MEAQEPILSARGLHHRYSSREILKGVDLAVHPGDRLGLVGANGAGKSTLLKLMAGLEKPDAGEVVKQRGLRVGYLPQDFSLDPASTVLDAVKSGAADTLALRERYEALSAELSAASGPALERLLAEQSALTETLEHQDAWHLENRLANVMQRLGVPPGDRRCGELSGGEARRVSLARALVARPDLLILDEPTNHLDAATIAWLEKFLADYPGSVLLITHDRYFLDRVANRIIELEHGTLQNYTGDYSDYLETKAVRLAGMASAEASRQNTLRRELAWVRKQPRARQAKSKSREEAYYTLLADAPPPSQDEIQLKIPQGPVRLGKKVVDLLGVTKRQGGKTLFENLTLKLAPGERIGVVGPNGAGKTTLMRIIQGLEAPDAGSVEIGPTARFVYADQGRSRIDLAKSLVEELAVGGTHITVDEEERISLRNYLRRFLFTDDQQNVPMAKFSGGEQNRAQLAKLLAVGGNVLIFDEPTNDLDLPTLRALEDGLAEFPGCAFVVSHDRYFLNRVATAILAFEGDGVVRYEVGDYDRYLEVKAREAAEAASLALPKAAPAPAAPKSGAKKLSYKETQELAGMEEAILAAETRLAELESSLADPTLYAERAAEVPALTAETEAQRAAVEGLYARWEALEALKAGA